MMESWLRSRKIWVYTQVVDFRKQLDGLVGIIGNEMGLKAEDGIYVFRNRNRDKLKIILWDRNGFVMGYKRLERGRFDFPEDDDEIIKMDLNQLEMLVSGMPMIRVGKREKMDIFLT